MIKAILLTTALLCASFASATTITASKITNDAGAKLSGKLCFRPEDDSGNAIPYRSGANQVTAQTTCALVSNGALQGSFSVYDSDNTVPTNVRYHITFVMGKTVIRDFGVTTITGDTWSLDSFDASSTALPAIYTSTSTSGDLTVNGSLTAKSVSDSAGSLSDVRSALATEVSRATTVEATKQTIDSNCKPDGSGNLTCTSATLSKTISGSTITLPGGTNAAGTIAAAIAAGYKTIVLPSSYTEAVPVMITLGDGVSVRCMQGATLTAGVSSLATIFRLYGTGNGVDGCSIDFSAATTSGTKAGIFLTSCTRCSATNNYIYGINNGFNGIFVTNANQVKITHNRIIGAGNGINVVRGGSGYTITDNYVDSSSVSLTAGLGAVPISFGSWGYTPALLSDFVISNNTTYVANSFCIAVAAAGGTTPTRNGTVANNTCYIRNTTGTADCETGSPAMACGGFTIVGNTYPTATTPGPVYDLTITGNVVYATGQNVAIAGYEIGCSDCVVSNNTYYGSGVTTAKDVGIILNNTARVTVEGNVINGWGITGTNYGIGMQMTGSSTYSSQNIITGNSITMPSGGGSAYLYGISIDCGHTSSTSMGNIITGNSIAGMGASNRGIGSFQNAGSTCIASSNISENTIDNVGYALMFAGSSTNSVTIGTNNLTNISTAKYYTGGDSPDIHGTMPVLISSVAFNSIAGGDCSSTGIGTAMPVSSLSTAITCSPAGTLGSAYLSWSSYIGGVGNGNGSVMVNMCNKSTTSITPNTVNWTCSITTP